MSTRKPPTGLEQHTLHTCVVPEGTGKNTFAQKRGSSKQPTTAFKFRARGTHHRSSIDAEDESDIGEVRMKENSVSDLHADEDEDDAHPHPPKRRRIAVVDSSETGSDNDSYTATLSLPNTRSKRRLRRHSSAQESKISLPSHLARLIKRGEQDHGGKSDHEEDLLEEVDSDRIIQNRLRTRGKKSAHQKALEKMRERKTGRPSSSVSGGEISEQSVSETKVFRLDDASPFPGAKPCGQAVLDLGSEADDDDDDDFIIEDDSQGTMPALPVAYSMSTYQDFSHHFKVICQLLVHLAVQDPDDRHAFMQESLKDEYFFVPLQIARRKLDGIRDSSVASSVWQTTFKRPLERYPDFTITELDFSLPGCHACRLGGRISTLVGRVSGSRYDPLTYEEITPDSGSESQEEEELDQSRFEYNLGRFCARRSEAFHAFNHWEYHLFKTLKHEVDNLRNKRSKSYFVPVGLRGKSEIPTDTGNGDEVMKWLDDRGIIATEFSKINKLMEMASHLEISQRGEGVES